MRGVTKQSNEVMENRVTRKKFQGSKILKSFKNMYFGVSVKTWRFSSVPRHDNFLKNKAKIIIETT